MMDKIKAVLRLIASILIVAVVVTIVILLNRIRFVITL